MFKFAFTERNLSDDTVKAFSEWDFIVHFWGTPLGEYFTCKDKMSVIW